MNSKFYTNYSEETFISKIEHSLEKCESFLFSVSFIKKAGLTFLEKHIEQALKRGVRGRIITSTYQNFTDIPSLNVFLSWQKLYPNFECHLEYESFKDCGFHSKGYIFDYKENSELVVGSTNITRFALLKNIEWNLSYESYMNDLVVLEAKKEFDFLWNKTLPLEKEIISKYQMQLDYAIEKWDMDYFEPENMMVHPNKMQKAALKELRRYRDMGNKKALIISATASGKTYLAAFDARNFGAQKILFVVHRETILKDALDTFAKVFGSNKTYALYTGRNKNSEADFIFATNSMLSLHLDEFLPNEFDYIVIDEVHHATASTYQKIINYFKPDFLLGLTATPERMDNQDVFNLFDYNVPYELRLRDALLNDLVVPFHYYGIRDKLIDYSLNDHSKIAHNIAENLNCAFISKEITKHHPKGKLKAIAFCVSISHAKLMAEKMEIEGFNTTYLTGNNDTGERILAFKKLQDDNDPLEIIFAVDILNEGVDIPGINMVLFLRPTESSTIFIQQLGRGLRKYPGKEYVTVLDFIGNNYNRSIQMAIALGTLGKTTYMEKAYLMDLVRNDFNALDIPGVVINIDTLSKEEVLSYLKNENFNKEMYLIKDYQNFKNYLKLSTYPSHMDYLESDLAPDLLRFLNSSLKGSKNYSYYSFLSKIGEEELPVFSSDQKYFIDQLSDFLPLVRKEEYLIIKELLNDVENLELLINDKITKDTIQQALTILTKKKLIIDMKLNVENMSDDFKDYLRDLIDYGLKRYDIEFGDFEGKFKLYANYMKSQVLMILGKTSLNYMKGTLFNDDETVVFVGIKKDLVKEQRHNYKDKFLNSKLFQWESVNNTTMSNADGIKILKTKKVHLFVRKMDSDCGITLPFTYFGEGVFTNIRPSKNGEFPTLLCDIVLDNEVPKDYYFDFEIQEGVI